MKVVYSAKAIKHLHSLDRGVSKRIVRKIETNAVSSNPFATAKQLVSNQKLYRYRIGDYRAVFEINEHGDIDILFVLVIKHRKNVYKIDNLY